MGHVEVVNFLADKINVNTKNKDGLAPLHMATQSSKKEAVEALLNKGAEINLAGTGGWPYFIICCF